MLMCPSVTKDPNVIDKGLLGLQQVEPSVSNSSLCQRPTLDQCVRVCLCVCALYTLSSQKVILCFLIWFDLIATKTNFPVSAMICCDHCCALQAVWMLCVYVCVCSCLYWQLKAFLELKPTYRLLVLCDASTAANRQSSDWQLCIDGRDLLTERWRTKQKESKAGVGEQSLKVASDGRGVERKVFNLCIRSY